MYEFAPDEKKAYERMKLPFGIYQYKNNKAVTVLVSDGLCEARNMPREKLMTTLTDRMFESLHPEDAVRMAKIGKDFAEHLCEEYDAVYRSMHSDNTYHLIHTIGKRQIMENGDELAFLYYIDMTQSNSSIRKISKSYISTQRDNFYFDAITKIPNTNYFYEMAGEKINAIKSENKAPYLIFIDINGMQAFNSEYGFTKGNELLQVAAKKITETFKNDLTVRAYNDHFIILTGSTDIEANIYKINQQIKDDPKGNTTGIRAGIIKLEEGMSFTDAIDNAKICTKEIGNNLNTVFKYFSKELDEAYWNRHYIIESFNQAIEEKWIRIYYHPIIRVKSGKVSSCEALARWVDPKKGIITPGNFIPVLEKYHLLYKLDLYMAEEICVEVEKRRAGGLEIIPISVNFSGQDFDHINIAEKLEGILKKYGLSSDVLIIEITEQAVATATDNFKAQIKKLKDMGFKIWIDDFGSGYSSLNVFSQYHFDLVKFDMELMKHLNDNNGANRHIMKAIVEVAKKMHVHTLAEGIEMKEHVDFLKEIECDQAQGFYYMKPAPLEMLLTQRQYLSDIPESETKNEAVEADRL